VDYLKAQPVEPRVTRDFSKLLSLIKAVAIRRHVHRQRDGSGRLVATIDDYATVYELVASTYAASASGAGEKVREVVEAVATLAAAGGEPVRQADIARRIGKSRSTVSGHVTQAIAGGWLANAETTQGRPARLRIGEPLPDNAGLPTPQQLAELFDRSQCSVEGANDSSAMGAGTFADCSGVRPSTESRAEVGSSHVRHREEL
jgi:chromosome segregation and condensation protein ScpB